MNKENFEIWKSIVEKEWIPSENDLVDENGNYIKPLNFDEEQQEYDALRVIIDGAIKNKNYKTWKLKSDLVETYNDNHTPIEEFDVVYAFDSSFEMPYRPVLITNIIEDIVAVKFINQRNDEVITEHVKIEKK